MPRSEAVSRGHEVALAASARFKAPVSLEFEKVLQPFLLLNKKRYAGLPWENDVAQPLLIRGVESVRTDWCGLVRQVCERSLELLLRPEHTLDEAVEYVRGIVADMRRGAVDMRLLVMSKTLAKKGEADYVAKSAHVALAEKLRRRDPKKAPRPGDRVAFIVVAGASGAKVWERAEDPQYALARGLPIDDEYYIEHQLKLPLLRIFEPVVGSGQASKVASMLFAGGSGRKAAAPSTVEGSLGAFIRRGKSCLVCRAAVPDNEAFCDRCNGTEQALTARIAKASEGRIAQKRQEELRRTCRRCVGPSFGEETYARCANVDCTIYFERSQNAKAVEEAHVTFARLSLEW
eukprot:TRINITY_DN27969_c1_g1_i1.p1 TRINITY_DN27969_c1_g1~~TRINITY_DN27969_c1_g1_i1.p1  ORF type:complete len:347 (+),score=59.67 TRINITY_DN27969_c1_g1_i1:21-1061(+)